MKRIIVLVVSILLFLTLNACDKANEVSETTNAATHKTGQEVLDTQPGGLPTPFVADSLGEYVNDSYKRTAEFVDYRKVSSEEYRIRSVIEADRMYSLDAPYEKDVIKEVNKYGLKYYSMMGKPMFSTIESMESALQNKDFKQDFYKETGIDYDIEAYYLPSAFPADSMAILLPLRGVPYLQITGFRYTDDSNFFTIVWGIYSAPDMPDVIDIAEFYANLNGLEVESSSTAVGTVFHFTSGNGGAFFEKFSVRTNDPATAYLWQQDNVIGVIILPGEHKPENLDLCVLEKHEL